MIENVVELRSAAMFQARPEVLEAAQTSLDTLLEICRDHVGLREGESFTMLMADIVTAMPEEERMRPAEKVVAARLTSVLGEPPEGQYPVRGRAMMTLAIIADRIRGVTQRGDAVVGRLLAMNLFAYMPPKEAAGLLVGEGAGIDTIRAQLSPILRQVRSKGWETVAPRIHNLLHAPDATPTQFLELQEEVMAVTTNTKHRDRFLGKAVLGGSRKKASKAPLGGYFEEEEFVSTPTYLSEDTFGDYMKTVSRTKLLNAATEVVLAKRIEAGVVAAHILESESDVIAMAEHELRASGAFADEVPTEERARLVTMLRRDLQAVAREGEKAHERFVRANLRLVLAMATRRASTRSDISKLELAQYGSEGLLKAVSRFDYAKGFKFSTYAAWWIRREMDKGIYKQVESTGKPQAMFRLLSKLPTVERELKDTLGTQPTHEQLAEALEITVDKLIELLELKRNEEMVYLDELVGDGLTLSEVVNPERTQAIQHVSDVVSDAVIRDKISHALTQLPHRDREMLRYRYGFEDGEMHGLREVGERFGISGEGVRLAEVRVFERLRSAFPDLKALLE